MLSAFLLVTCLWVSAYAVPDLTHVEFLRKQHELQKLQLQIKAFDNFLLTECFPYARPGSQLSTLIERRSVDLDADIKVSRKLLVFVRNKFIQCKRHLASLGTSASTTTRTPPTTVSTTQTSTTAANTTSTPAPPDACTNYRSLTDSWRHVNNTQSGVHCDRSGFVEGWYRFEGSAGTRMWELADVNTMFRNPKDADNSPSCGTHAKMYISGTHPTQVNVITSTKVCGVWVGDLCRFQVVAKVIKCSQGYFVYHLPKTPLCTLAYCGIN